MYIQEFQKLYKILQLEVSTTMQLNLFAANVPLLRNTLNVIITVPLKQNKTKIRREIFPSVKASLKIIVTSFLKYLNAINVLSSIFFGSY